MLVLGVALQLHGALHTAKSFAYPRPSFHITNYMASFTHIWLMILTQRERCTWTSRWHRGRTRISLAPLQPLVDLEQAS